MSAKNIGYFRPVTIYQWYINGNFLHYHSKHA